MRRHTSGERGCASHSARKHCRRPALGSYISRGVQLNLQLHPTILSALSTIQHPRPLKFLQPLLALSYLHEEDLENVYSLAHDHGSSCGGRCCATHCARSRYFHRLAAWLYNNSTRERKCAFQAMPFTRPVRSLSFCSTESDGYVPGTPVC